MSEPRYITIILDREEMATRGRIGAYRRWSKEPDRAAATLPARTAFLARFEQRVDPEGILTPEKRAELAEYARKAHFVALGRRSGLKRAAKADSS